MTGQNLLQPQQLGHHVGRRHKLILIDLCQCKILELFIDALLFWRQGNVALRIDLVGQVQAFTLQDTRRERLQEVRQLFKIPVADDTIEAMTPKSLALHHRISVLKLKEVVAAFAQQSLVQKVTL